MFSNFFLTTTDALEDKNGASIGTMSRYKAQEHDLVDYVLVFLLIMFIGMIPWLMWRVWQGPSYKIVENQVKDTA